MIQLSQVTATGKAHGKLILVGEHSVVYGKPAIALPFPLIEVKATVEESSGKIWMMSDYYGGPLSMVPKKLKGIEMCIYETLKKLNRPKEGLFIRLSSTIPLGRGLGSSAAIAIAIVRGLFAFCDREPSGEELMSLVHIAETYAHGNPSGVDMFAASSDAPIWFQKEKSTQLLQMVTPIYLVVADSGRYGDTFTAVNSVREKVTLHPTKTMNSLDTLGQITCDARLAIATGNTVLLGHLMDSAQKELTELGVSDEGINKLVVAARSAGALGAKLTGGGRGGCVIALAENFSHSKILSEALVKAGASRTWNFALGSNRGDIR